MTQTNDKVAVSLTPVAAGADSRTIRVAESLARAGFKSLIWESVTSSENPCAGLQCSMVNPPSTEVAREVIPRSIRTAGRLAPFLSKARHGAFGSLGEMALFGALRFEYHRRYAVGKRIPDAALYYVHSYELFRAVSARAASLNAPVIYDAHDFYQGIRRTDELPSFDRRWMMPFLRKREAEAVAKCDAIVTVSEGIADLIEEEYDRRPIVLRNAHDPLLDIEPEATLRQTLGLSRQHRLYVCVGNYKPGMAVREVMDAVALRPESNHVAFVGHGYEDGLADLEKHPARARVHWGLARPSRKVVPFIRDADAGLVIYKPRSENYREALPNGFFQVLAAGLPIIYPVLPQLAAAIGTDRIGVCLQEISAGAIVEALERIDALSPSEAHGKSALSSRLSWRADERKLMSLVSDLMSKRAVHSVATNIVSGQKGES